MTVRFSNQLVADLIQPFWAAWQAGEFMPVGRCRRTEPGGFGTKENSKHG